MKSKILNFDSLLNSFEWKNVQIINKKLNLPFYYCNKNETFEGEFINYKLKLSGKYL